MNASFEDRKLAEALASVGDIIAKLKENRAESWLGYFERLEACLAARDIEGAVHARDAVPFAGMGAFGDFLETMLQLRSAIEPSRRQSVRSKCIRAMESFVKAE